MHFQLHDWAKGKLTEAFCCCYYRKPFSFRRQEAVVFEIPCVGGIGAGREVRGCRKRSRASRHRTPFL